MTAHKVREIARITALEQVESKFDDLMGMLIGKNVFNNRKVIRMDCPITRDAVFYERIK